MSYTRSDLNQTGVDLAKARLALDEGLNDLADELRRGGLTRISLCADDCLPLAKEVARLINELSVIAEQLWAAPQKPVLAYRNEERAS